MRPKERIPIILKVLKDNWEFYLKDNLKESYSPTHLDEITCSLGEIKSAWNKWPDYRLGQLLVNMEFIPDVYSIFFKEETSWLIENKLLKPRDIVFWGTRGKTGKAKLKNVLIKNMSEDHIKNILKDYDSGKQPLTKNLHKLFKNELNIRKHERIKERTQW